MPRKGRVIAAIARGAAGNAAFGFQFQQGLMERQQRVGGRSEAELAVAFQSGPLRVEIEAESPRAALGGQQRRAARQHESEARHAFDALIGRRNQEIRVSRREIDRNRAEAAHGIHDVLRSGARHHRADFLDRD